MNDTQSQETQERAANRIAANAQRDNMLRGVPTTLYLYGCDIENERVVADWAGIHKYPATRYRKTRIGGVFSARPVYRETAQFIGPDGQLWYIDVRGDMQCGTARRYKNQPKKP